MTLIAMLGLPFLACTLLAAILGYMGVHVLKREVIFIDIAVAQIAALGAIGSHLLLHIHGDSPLSLLCGIGATVVAALFFAIMRRTVSRLPIEALIGITYAIAAAGTLFVIGKSSDGHTHILEMLSGALLWVTPRDLFWLAITCGAVGSVFFLLRRPLQQRSDRHGTADETKQRTLLWDFLFYSLCGIVITVAVKLAGVVVVFSFLIIPSTVSALFSQQWNMRFLLAWLTGTFATFGGLLFGYFLDFSIGASIALFLVIILVGAGTLQSLRKNKAPNPDPTPYS